MLTIGELRYLLRLVQGDADGTNFKLSLRVESKLAEMIGKAVKKK